MPYSILRAFLIVLALSLACGCTAWQPTKEVWKTTKGLWYNYVSPPAHVDYDDKGNVPPEGLALSQAIMGIDMELGKLERVMQNADKPPTREWLDSLFANFPWLNGFAGIKYDGSILGQEPPDSLKQLDFIPLLYEDAKQGSRALRADAQPGPLGPEIILATPLYDGVDFLGIVAAYFDMRSLMRFSNNANDIVVLTPGALLWPGRYDFAATPLAGVDWGKVVRESTSGTCANSAGSFYYMVRYLGNLPMVFAIPASGSFPEGNGSLEQGNPYFPQKREKLPPPPVPERKSSSEARIPAFEKPAEPEPEARPEPAPSLPEASEKNVIRQGSGESMLLRKQQPRKRRQLRERELEEPMPARESPRDSGPAIDLIPDVQTPKLRGGRPSPFGPKQAPDVGSGAPATMPETAAQAPAEGASADQPSAGTGGTAPDAQKDAASSNAATNKATQPAPETPAQPESKEQAAPMNSGPDAKSDEARSTAGEKDAASSTSAKGTEKTAPRKPALLPGGRPSPFGPRN